MTVRHPKQPQEAHHRGASVAGLSYVKRGHMILALNIAMAAIVVVLLLSGNVGVGLIAAVAFAIVALRLGRRDTKAWHRQSPDRAIPVAVVGAAHPERPGATPPPPSPDPLEAIARLADLRDRGAITSAEFDAKKSELLARA
jgi:Flp pilus assembly protein TadB